MEFEHYQQIALIGFLAATAFGAISSRTNFCTMGAISDWVNMGSLTRLRVWLMAMGIALVLTQTMQGLGLIDLKNSIYLTTNFTWLGHVLGGFLFGIGMTIGSGCGQRTLVRVGGGNLKSLVLLLVLAITAYATLRGLLALPRLEINDATVIDLAQNNIPSQGLPDLIGGWINVSPDLVALFLTTLFGGFALIFALSDRQIRSRFDNLLAGLGIGLLIAGAWYMTGVLGQDDFDPLPLEGFSFIAPVGNTLTYVMTYTGSTINFGISVVVGLIFGSFLYSLLSGTFRVESFNDKADLMMHLSGGVLMGFGGVLSLGCTIGQGLTGLSTLALGSFISVLFIILGCVFTLKMQYYLYDDEGWWYALKSTLNELRFNNKA